MMIRFDHYRNLEAWVRSSDHTPMVAKVDPILEEGDKMVVNNGMEFWFAPEAVQAKIPTHWAPPCGLVTSAGEILYFIMLGSMLG